ncbi:MAG: hypothetical protein N2257_06895 [Thermodesulfovibrionales bacterium]|nr:hypothetical protein [Thermodesulfovibrionales bacterium]
MKDERTLSIDDKGFRHKIYFIIIYMPLLINLFLAGCYKAPPSEPYRIEELNRAMERAAKAFERNDTDMALSLYKEALKRARLVQDDRLTLIILINLSRLLISASNIEEANEVINTAKSLLRRSEVLGLSIPEELREELYLNEIEIDFFKKDLQALGSKEYVKNILLSTKNVSVRTRALNLYARIEILNCRYEKAESYLLESLRINNFSMLERANSHRILGEVYAVSGKAEAEYHLLEALRIDKNLAIPEKIGLDMEILGRYYRDKDRERSREYLQRALEIWNLRSDRERIEEVQKLLIELEGQ